MERPGKSPIEFIVDGVGMTFTRLDTFCRTLDAPEHYPERVRIVVGPLHFGASLLLPVVAGNRVRHSPMNVAARQHLSHHSLMRGHFAGTELLGERGGAARIPAVAFFVFHYRPLYPPPGPDIPRTGFPCVARPRVITFDF